MKLDQLRKDVEALIKDACRAIIDLSETANLENKTITNKSGGVVVASVVASGGGGVTQTATVTFGVVLVVDNQRGDTGSPVDEMMAFCDAVRAKLIGVGVDGASPLTYLGGELTDSQSAYLLWVDRYETKVVL